MIHHSRLPEVAIPDEALPGFVLRKEGAPRDKTALVDGTSGRTLTYADLERGARRAARALQQRGFGKGDVLALWSRNALEYPIAFFAAALAGLATTTLNPLSTVEEGRRQLEDSAARVLVAGADIAAKAQEAARDTGVREVLAFGPDFDAWLAEPEIDGQVAVDPATDIVALPYSSGTTGLPKGVMLTHKNLIANVLQVAGAGHCGRDDVFVCVLPMFHIYGLVAILCHCLRLGATIVVMPRYDLESLLAAVERWRVTFLHLVPPIALQLLQSPLVARHDLSSLRAIFSGAAPLSAEVSRALADRFACRVYQGYGMTEASPATHMSPSDPARNRHGAVGEVLPSTECMVVDIDGGRPLGPGARGELWVRGPQVMKGYLNRDDATRATVDEKGWLRTGDVGYADDDGQFWVVDRLKELIKYKGLQVAPAELEAVLLAHPAVADAAVIGVPDPQAGEVPKAFVVRRAPVEAAELLAHVEARVAPYKKVRALEFVLAIPKSASGKILRRVLRGRD